MARDEIAWLETFLVLEWDLFLDKFHLNCAGGKFKLLQIMVHLGIVGIILIVVSGTFLVLQCLARFIEYLIDRFPAFFGERSGGSTAEIRTSRGQAADGDGVPTDVIIQSLPLLTYSKSGAHLPNVYLKSHMRDCPVCLSKYKEAECIRFLPNCKHVFHPKCINTWLESHSTCPLCRTDVRVPRNAKRVGNFSPDDRQVVQQRVTGGISGYHQDISTESSVTSLPSSPSTFGSIPAVSPAREEPQASDAPESQMTTTVDVCPEVGGAEVYKGTSAPSTSLSSGLPSRLQEV